jgi:hypothetical protein
LIHPGKNRTGEAIPSPDEVRAFVRHLIRRLHRLLRATDGVDAFYDELIVQIQAGGFRD